MSMTSKLAFFFAIPVFALGIVSLCPAEVTGPYPSGSGLHLYQLDELASPYLDTGSATPIPLSDIGVPVPIQIGAFGDDYSFALAVGMPSALDGLGGGEDIPVTDILGANHATEGFTVEALVQLASLTGTNREIVTLEGDGAPNERPFQFRITGTGGLEFHNISGLSTGGTSVQFITPLPTTGPEAFVEGAWYHAAITYNGNEGEADNVKLYWTLVDSSRTEATLLSSHTMDRDVVSLIADFAIGNELRETGGSSEGLFGNIDSVRISAGALGPGQFIFSVPEPSSLGMLGVCALLMSAFRRRRR